MDVIVNCSFCGNKIVADYEKLEKAMTDNGAINWFTIGYGSKFDGEQWLIALCDECLEKCVPLEKKDYLP